MERTFFTLAALLGGLAVALGAFGAHALSGRVEAPLLEVFETGVRYHFYHALALLAVVFALNRWPNAGLVSVAGWLFVVGIVVFSGKRSVHPIECHCRRWRGRRGIDC